jgi:hypothetical protein
MHYRHAEGFIASFQEDLSPSAYEKVYMDLLPSHANRGSFVRVLNACTLLEIVVD